VSSHGGSAPEDAEAGRPGDGGAGGSAPGASSAHPGPRFVPALLSALVPGLGQLRLGQHGRALVFLAPLVVAAAVVVAIVAAAGPTRAAASLVSSEALWALIGAQVALLAWRVLAAATALADRRFGRLGRRDAIPTIALAAILVVPQAWALAVTNAARVAADEVFQDAGGRGGGAWVPPARPTPVPSPTAAPTLTPSPVPTPTPAPPRVNVLLIGVDAGVGRNTFLTDTMIVASLDPVAGTVSLVSIPRDTVDVPLPDGSVFRDKLNSLVSWARHHPAQFPGSSGDGYDVLMGAVGTLLDIKVDLYAQVTLGGLVWVVDKLGGIDVNVSRGFCDPQYREYGYPNGFSITAGRHHLNGSAALAYARVRRVSGESDFTRAARQQEVLSGIRDAIVNGRWLNDPIGLLDALGRTITTNIPRSMVPDLAVFASEIGRGDTYRAVISHPLVRPDYDSRGSIQVPDVPAIRAFVATILTPVGTAPDPTLRAPDPLTGRATTSGVGNCLPAPAPTPAATPAPSATPTPSATATPKASATAAPTTTAAPTPKATAPASSLSASPSPAPLG
jgi:LCP family protein required for cell wall assembly